MLFPQALWPGLADGRITIAIRRWQRPTVKAGGTLQSPVGVLAIDAVEPIDERALTAATAKAAGYDDVAALRATLRPTGTLMRVRFHRLGDDPRIALREQPLSADEVTALRHKLDAIDARAEVPWTRDVLTAIRDGDGVRAADLAAALVPAMDKDDFKLKVRRLKNLGLTESLGTGYRLSPRGHSLLSTTAKTPKPKR